MEVLNRFLVALVVILLSPPPTEAQQSTFIRELWIGEFSQGAPMPWSGRMELYIRYDPEEPTPQPLSGVLTWPDLGGARTKIEGTRTERGIEFRETECLETACSKVMIGGAYEANYRSGGTALIGTAALAVMQLQGTFRLRLKNAR